MSFLTCSLQLLRDMDELRDYHDNSMQTMVASFKREMQKQAVKEAQASAKKDELIARQKEEHNITKGNQICSIIIINGIFLFDGNYFKMFLNITTM